MVAVLPIVKMNLLNISGQTQHTVIIGGFLII